MMNHKNRNGSLGLGVMALFVAIGLGGLTSPVGAQEPEVAADPLKAALFAPELIMKHRRAIDLDDEQRDAISRLIRDLQGRVVGYQWELLDDMQALTDVLDGPRVDLDLALDRMGNVLDKEKQVKQAHLELLVRIKNVLTLEQQTRLRELRNP